MRSWQSAEDADFPEFLLMMKHLLDINFAKIKDKTTSRPLGASNMPCFAGPETFGTSFRCGVVGWSLFRKAPRQVFGLAFCSLLPWGSTLPKLEATRSTKWTELVCAAKKAAQQG